MNPIWFFFTTVILIDLKYWAISSVDTKPGLPSVLWIDCDPVGANQYSLSAKKLSALLVTRIDRLEFATIQSPANKLSKIGLPSESGVV